MYFVKQVKREDVPGIFCDEDFLQLNAWSVDIFEKKKNLLTLIDNLFLNLEKTHIYLLIHFLNKVQSLSLLPRNFRNQKNIHVLQC